MLLRHGVLRTDWLNVSLLLFQIWYLASRIFRSLFPNTQGAVTRFNPYEFLMYPIAGINLNYRKGQRQQTYLALVFNSNKVIKTGCAA